MSKEEQKEKGMRRPNWYFGMKVCYNCKEIYSKETECPNCRNEIWDNLRIYHITNKGKTHINCDCFQIQEEKK